MHSAAALADCRMALIGTGWTISFLVSTSIGIETTPRGTISDIIGNCWSGGALADQRALTIESSLMSGCG